MGKVVETPIYQCFQQLMRMKGLEPSLLAKLEPKSSTKCLSYRALRIVCNKFTPKLHPHKLNHSDELSNLSGSVPVALRKQLLEGYKRFTIYNGFENFVPKICLLYTKQVLCLQYLYLSRINRPYSGSGSYTIKSPGCHP